MAQAEMVGKRFAMLTVLAEAGVYGSAQHKTYICLCDCGTKKVIVGASIRAGRTQSCGCLAKKTQFNSESAKTHGLSRSRIYKIWLGMKQRCSDKSTGKSRRLYYDKGIRICDRWKDFGNFVTDMGIPMKSMTIDRIDGNGNYEPENCRWATKKEQANNTAANHQLSYDGKKMNITQWSEQIGIKQNTIVWRLMRGWSVEKALTKPIQQRKRT